MSVPQVLVRTFPPNQNPNYGGVLQAWALQRSIDSLGLVASVDGTRLPISRVQELKSLLSAASANSAIARLMPRATFGPFLSTAGTDSILDFADTSIRRRDVYRSRRRVDTDLIDSFAAFVAGSDQIWRPSFMNVPSYLFDFLRKDDPRPKISYAASFGTDDPHFTAQQLRDTRALAQRLDAISVREESAVRIADELWGVQATRVADPTLLVDRSSYIEIAGQQSTDPPIGMASYLLDRDVKAPAASALASGLGVKVTDLFRAPPKTLQAYTSFPDQFRALTVPAWLSAIVNSDFVVTDSYHGTIFAILFERPFLVVPNAVRGKARFDSLLALFDLAERAVTPDELTPVRMLAPIDWSGVRETVARERAQGNAFLEHALTGVIPR